MHDLSFWPFVGQFSLGIGRERCKTLIPEFLNLFCDSVRVHNIVKVIQVYVHITCQCYIHPSKFDKAPKGAAEHNPQRYTHNMNAHPFIFPYLSVLGNIKYILGIILYILGIIIFLGIHFLPFYSGLMSSINTEHGHTLCDGHSQYTAPRFLSPSAVALMTSTAFNSNTEVGSHLMKVTALRTTFTILNPCFPSLMSWIMTQSMGTHLTKVTLDARPPHFRILDMLAAISFQQPPPFSQRVHVHILGKGKERKYRENSKKKFNKMMFERQRLFIWEFQSTSI